MCAVWELAFVFIVLVDQKKSMHFVECCPCSQHWLLKVVNSKKLLRVLGSWLRMILVKCRGKTTEFSEHNVYWFMTPKHLLDCPILCISDKIFWTVMSKVQTVKIHYFIFLLLLLTSVYLSLTYEYCLHFTLINLVSYFYLPLPQNLSIVWGFALFYIFNF